MKRLYTSLIVLFIAACTIILTACSSPTAPSESGDIVGDGGAISGHSYEDGAKETWEFGLDGKVYSYADDQPDETYFRGSYEVYLDDDTLDYINEELDGSSCISDDMLARIEKTTTENYQRLVIPHYDGRGCCGRRGNRCR